MKDKDLEYYIEVLNSHGVYYSVTHSLPIKGYAPIGDYYVFSEISDNGGGVFYSDTMRGCLKGLCERLGYE